MGEKKDQKIDIMSRVRRVSAAVADLPIAHARFVLNTSQQALELEAASPAPIGNGIAASDVAEELPTDAARRGRRAHPAANAEGAIAN